MKYLVKELKMVVASKFEPRLEQEREEFCPSNIGSDLDSSQDDYNYRNIGKGIVHVWIIPLLLAFFWEPKVSLVYELSVLALYSTVFSYKSEEYFGVLVFSILVAAVMIAS